MYELSAYVALVGFARGRSVVVHGARRSEGPLLLARLADNVREIDVHGDRSTALWWSEVPDHSVDLVCSIDGYGQLDALARAQVAREAGRILRDDGVFAVWWCVSSAASDLDYWRLDHELNAGFEHVRVLAQMPWSGSCFASVRESNDVSRVQLELDERLCPEPVDAVAYLALASNREVLLGLDRRCLLVASPATAASSLPPSLAATAGDAPSRIEPSAVMVGDEISSDAGPSTSWPMDITWLRRRGEELDEALSHARLQLDDAHHDAQRLHRLADSIRQQRDKQAVELARQRERADDSERELRNATAEGMRLRRELDTRIQQVTELEKRTARLRRALENARQAGDLSGAAGPDTSASLRRSRLEAEIRAQEQAVMLAQLEQLEQLLWGSTDPSHPVERPVRNQSRIEVGLEPSERLGVR